MILKVNISKLIVRNNVNGLLKLAIHISGLSNGYIGWVLLIDAWIEFTTDRAGFQNPPCKERCLVLIEDET